VGLLEPFSQQRFSIHTLYVADPFFALPLSVTFMLLLINRKWQGTRLAKIALVLGAAYMIYAFVNKYTVEKAVKAQLVNPQLSFFTSPSPFNTWLWFVVVKDGTGYQVGYRSVFDEADRLTAFTHVDQRNDFLALAKDKETVRKLVQFADGWYTVEMRNDTLLFNIPRFGQVTGWADGSLPFVFHYYLDLPDGENKLVMQRGRFQNWNAETRAELLRRIQGD
jgi:inner membrane protein